MTGEATDGGPVSGDQRELGSSVGSGAGPGRRFGAVAVRGIDGAALARDRRVSAAVCALGALYLVPLLWILVVLVLRRGPSATFERAYAWASLLFHLEVFAVVSMLTLPFVLDGGRTIAIVVPAGVVAAAAAFVSVYAAVCALVGSGFAWPTVPRRVAPAPAPSTP